MHKTAIIIASAALALVGAAPAQTPRASCDVRDAAEIRSQPGGPTVARVGNGDRVELIFDRDVTDSRGHLWSLVARGTNAAPEGYVLADYLDCRAK